MRSLVDTTSYPLLAATSSTDCMSSSLSPMSPNLKLLLAGLTSIGKSIFAPLELVDPIYSKELLIPRETTKVLKLNPVVGNSYANCR